MKSKKALLIIDPQKIYTTKGSELFCPDWEGTVGRINQLSKLFADAHLPIVLVRHVHKPDGSDLGRMFDYTGEVPEDFNFKDGTEEVAIEGRVVVPKKCFGIVKTRYSAFVGTNLRSTLDKARVTDVAITGFMTNFCCESTAREAHDLDYFVDFIVDATGTPGTTSMNEQQVRDAVADFMGLGFARVYSTLDYKKIL
jgi:ureidoacrylate peracid hydrolase